MKKWKLALIAGMTAVSLAACSGGKNVVVKIKDDNITQDEFYKELKDKYGAEVLSSMIQDSILKDKYPITKKELNERIEYYKKMTGIEKDADFETYVKSAGFKDLDAFKVELENNLMQVKAMTDGVKVNEKDVKTKYEDEKSQISASHILVSDEALANDIYNKIKKGEKFEDMVAKYSSDTASQANKGNLGFFSKGTMDAAFEKVAFSMKKGEVSKPVKTSFGYHIIRLDDTKVVPFKDLKDSIEEELKMEKAKSLDTVLTKLKKSYEVEIEDKDMKKAIEDAANTTTNNQAQTTTATN